MTTITALPTAPSRSDPTTFSARSDALLGALDQFVTETNAVAGECVTNAATATTQAGLATTNGAAQVALAAAQVVLATAQADAAAISAGDSSASAAAADISATAAAASALSAATSALTAGATVWVSGASYVIGDVRYSPANYQCYRRKTNGAGTTDPSADTTNWALALSLAGLVGAASTIIETHTATPSQTVFNLSNTYTVGVNGINVYINGVRQFPSAFTETSTSVITLSSGATSGDVVLFEIGVITSGTATAASAVTFSPTADIPETTLQSALANYATGHGATQAQMEEASDTTVFATPAVVKNHPGVAKFWVKCDAAGNIEASHNVTSITDGGTGVLTVTIATDFSSSSYVVTASAHAGGTATWVDITSIAAGSVVLRAKDYANNAVDPTAWFIVGFGDQ